MKAVTCSIKGEKVCNYHHSYLYRVSTIVNNILLGANETNVPLQVLNYTVKQTSWSHLEPKTWLSLGNMK